MEELTRLLCKKTFEAMLEGEMDEYLGYGKHDKVGHHSGNSPNGYSSKTVKGEYL